MKEIRNLEIARYQARDLHGMAALRDSYKEKVVISGKELFPRKLQDDNSLGAPLMVVARDGDRVVATLGATYKQLKVSGSLVLCTTFWAGPAVWPLYPKYCFTALFFLPLLKHEILHTQPFLKLNFTSFHAPLL